MSRKRNRPKPMPEITQHKFEVVREFKAVTPETVLKGRFCGSICSCEGCLAQARKDSRNDTLTYLQTEISKVDGKITDIEIHAVPYIEIKTL